MKKKLLAIFVGSFIVLGACGSGEDNAEPAENNGAATENVAAKEIYGQYCASCHGQNLEGGVGVDLTKVGSKLDAAEIESIIINGQGAMPAGLLQGEDAKVVAEWLATKK